MKAVPRIPTRPFRIARVINSRAFAVACYIAALVAVLLANAPSLV